MFQYDWQLLTHVSTYKNQRTTVYFTVYSIGGNMFGGFGFGGGGGNGIGGGFGFGGPARRRGGNRFNACYQCFPVAMHGTASSSELEKGDKIILPQSALNELSRMEVQYPMLFRLTNAKQDSQKTHCGVMEFSATEGNCYIPHWMMQNLLLSPGDLLRVDNVSLPKATYVKIRPQSVDFIELSNPKAVLESALRKFSCLTQDDQICVPHNGKNYYLDIREVRPGKACSIIETDVNLDFEKPVGYKEPVAKAPPPPAAPKAVLGGNIAAAGSDDKKKAAGDDDSTATSSLALDLSALAKERAARKEKRFEAFSGSGRRVDGKRNSSSANAGTDGKKTDNFVSPEPPAKSLKRDLGKYRKQGKQLGSVFGSGGRTLGGK